jgi:hypothetical protein
MAQGLGRSAPLAIITALLVTVAAVGPAVATDSPVIRVTSLEKYAKNLLNCTRTGGWVQADGTCIDRGTGKHSAYRPPLPRHKGITRKVAWPWARAMIKHDVCGHYIAGLPTLRQRLNRKGFTHHAYGENLGCGWGYGDPKQVVLAVHRMFQAEKSTGGGHWRNMKKWRYKSVGVAIATRDGHTTVVYDFYGKRW